MKLWSRSLIAGQSAHGPEHGAIAAESADEIGDRFGEKNAGDAQPADLRQNDRQRHDDDDLAKEREKRRLLALAESDEGALADGLKSHEENLAYREPVTVTVNVAPDDDGRYTISDEDVTSIYNAMIYYSIDNPSSN